jgi:DNA-binding CsgD family transcriptional regulator
MLERIQAMRRAGMSWRRIGDQLGLSESTARKWLERAGLKPDHPPGTVARPWKPPVNRSKHTPESDREICRLRAEGRTYPEIAKAVGMARCTVQNRCEHLGVRNHVAAQRKLESLPLPAQEVA